MRGTGEDPPRADAELVCRIGGATVRQQVPAATDEQQAMPLVVDRGTDARHRQRRGKVERVRKTWLAVTAESRSEGKGDAQYRSAAS